MELTRYQDSFANLTDKQIPGVGDKPDSTHKKAGSWDKDLTNPENLKITQDTTFTYTYTEKDTPQVTAPQAKSLTYNGSDQELVIEGSTTGGTMKYAIGSDAQTPPADNIWNTAVPEGKEAKTYYVWYCAEGDDNYLDSDKDCVTVTIEPKSINGATVTLDNGYWYYLNPWTGAMATGWVWDNDNWYYLYPLSGIMVTGDCLIDGTWYSFADSGAWVG